MKLSLLICHLHAREITLRRLLDCLNDQREGEAFAGDVEILVESDGGERSTGAKRNTLLDRATGEYVAFIDDDDLVSPDYLRRILSALETAPDCLGMEVLMTRGGEERRHPQKCIHSIRYDHWWEEGVSPNATYFRCPNHLNPIRRDLARTVGFHDQTIGEDREFSLAIRPMLTSEVFLDGPIYFYLAD